MANLDIYFAFALVLVVVFVFVASRVGILPKKSIPLVLGAIVGIVGIEVFRKRRVDALLAHAKELEERIKKRDEELDRLEQERQLSQRELNEARAQLDRQLAAAVKQTLLIEAKDRAERERIEGLDLPSTIAEFRKAIAEETARQAAKSTQAGSGVQAVPAAQPVSTAQPVSAAQPLSAAQPVAAAQPGSGVHAAADMQAGSGVHPPAVTGVELKQGATRASLP